MLYNPANNSRTPIQPLFNGVVVRLPGSPPRLVPLVGGNNGGYCETTRRICE
jgi:hypothetical protein